VIELIVPRNVFVNEYRTNWVERTVTNVVDVSLTNWSTRTVTNAVAMNLVKTNVMDRYQTNWTTLIMTNQVTLTLTNWETAVVTKTNWIKQPMVNVVEVNVPSAAAGATGVEATPSDAKAAAPGEPADALIVEATRTARPSDNNQVEVRFKVRWSGDAAASLQVQQWRVEREDGAVLFFGQNQEFKQAMPPGRYTVQVKARRDAGAPLLTVQSKLDVTRDAVVRR